jgi:metal-dependent hydrolase (beta-lactamase superfamily II)
VEIRGNQSGLRELVDLLVAGRGGDLRLDRPEMSTLLLTDRVLDQVSVRLAEGPVSIHVEDTTLLVSGASDSLQILAHNVEFVANHPEPTGRILSHEHIDYYDGHPFLADDSVPMIVTVVAESRS